ncbi:MAG: LysR family transcriptional regulator [Burkholderiaceae bacterium]
MKLAAFATLDAVLRGGTLAAAAVEMNLTPSAVSMQMKQLEIYLGQPLFDRSGLQVRPNTLAHDVAAAMREGLQRLEALRRRPSTRVEGTIRLGLIDALLPVLLPGTMRLLRERYPALAVRPLRGRSAALTDAVKANEIDAAVVAEPPGGGSVRLRWQPLLRRELVLVAPPDTTESAPAALFRQHDWIRYDRQTISGMLAARYVTERFDQRRATLEMDSVPAIMAMVSAGLGISVVQLSDPSVTVTYPVRVVRLGRGAPVLQLSLITRKGDDDSRPMQVLKEAMDSVLAEAAKRRDAASR